MSMLRKIGFYCAFILPVLVLAGYYAGGGWNYSAVVFAFILIPLIDELVGKDSQNVDEKEAVLLSTEMYYRIITFIWTFTQLGIVFWGAYVVSFDTNLSKIEWWGLVLGMMTVTGGIGITVAHELGHKPDKSEQFFAKVILMTVCYMHFFIEHNRGHHVNVATPEDAATSRKNEILYFFLFRTIIGSYLNAWRLEAFRLKKKHISPFSIQNSMYVYTLLPVVFCAILTTAFSLWKGGIVWEVPVFFFTQSLFAFTLLEMVNYIEHYGIVRKKLPNGRYERVNPLHSWNASHLVSNFFLFQLQRHSDHHAYASRRYQILRHFDDSPQLPFGYPLMILIALVPPLWFSIMNKRLDNWESNQNLQQAA